MTTGEIGLTVGVVAGDGDGGGTAAGDFPPFIEEADVLMGEVGLTTGAIAGAGCDGGGAPFPMRGLAPPVSVPCAGAIP